MEINNKKHKEHTENWNSSQMNLNFSHFTCFPLKVQDGYFLLMEDFCHTVSQMKIRSMF